MRTRWAPASSPGSRSAALPGRLPPPEGVVAVGPLYVIRVNGLLHHCTGRLADHEEWAAKLRAAGHEVTTETRQPNPG